jgi:hypothetical protein
MTDAIAAVVTQATDDGGPAATAAAHAAVDAAAAWQELHAAARDIADKALVHALAVPCEDPAWEAFKTLHGQLSVALERSDERADCVSLFYATPPAGAA